MGKRSIRPIVLGLIKHQGHVFVYRGRDDVTQDVFYRFLGGGIDFGEAGVEALKREFQEEIQAELTNIEHLAWLENIFTCHGQPGHEIVGLFQCNFVDRDFYALERTYTLIEGDMRYDAVWIPVAQVKSGKLNLVPAACHAYID